MITVKEAQALVLKEVSLGKTTTVPLGDVEGFVLAEDVLADRDLPPFNRAKMDGYCFHSSDLPLLNGFGLTDVGTVKAGESREFKIGSGQALRIMTGAAVPKNLDTLVKIEDCQVMGGTVSARGSRYKIEESFIALKGEDAKQGQVLIEKGSVITPSNAAVMASVGYCDVKVIEKPKVGILTSGDEIIPVNQTPLTHQIRDCNGTSCRSMCARLGVDAEMTDPMEDTEESIEKGISAALEKYDILLLSGGVSMGDFDFIPSVLKKLGIRKVFYKVNLRPGKPIWFGMSENGVAVFALPGNPVSVQVNFQLFVRPYIRKYLGEQNPYPKFTGFKLANDFSKTFPLEYYFPVSVIDWELGLINAYHLNSSGDFAGLARADGIGKMDADCFSVATGDIVRVIPWNR